MDNIHFRAKEFFQPVFHTIQGQQRNPGSGEFNQQIHVAVRPPLPSSQGAKQLSFLDGVFLGYNRNTFYNLINTRCQLKIPPFWIYGTCQVI